MIATGRPHTFHVCGHGSPRERCVLCTPDFKCAIEEANRTGAKRCKARCPSCRIWWPDVRPDE